MRQSIKRKGGGSMNRVLTLALFALLSVAVSAGEVSARTVSDMAGRKIELPDRVTRIVTLGATPVVNGFLFAFGAQDEIVNGLPPQLAHKFQYVFAPQLAGKPLVQGMEGGFSIEAIIALRPDVVLTMDLTAALALERMGVPALYLRWAAPTDIEPLMQTLGDVLAAPDAAKEYAAYFDAVRERIRQRLAQTAPTARPRTLYVNLQRLTQPHLIAEWWIDQAGGRSVTDNGRSAESFTFSLEQMLAWDPQILIVANRRELAMALNDPRLQGLSCVRDKRIYVAPVGAHLWANRTVEEPLTLLWAASIIHPELFTSTEVKDEMKTFYARFFKVALSPEQIDEILADVP
jgi:iron complex transport system substrate-binding protein